MHPSTKHILQFFDYEHLPPHLKAISARFHTLAHDVANNLPSNPETTACLRKLLEAKDCAVRAVVAKKEVGHATTEYLMLQTSQGPAQIVLREVSSYSSVGDTGWENARLYIDLKGGNTLELCFATTKEVKEAHAKLATAIDALED